MFFADVAKEPTAGGPSTDGYLHIGCPEMVKILFLNDKNSPSGSPCGAAKSRS